MSKVAIVNSSDILPVLKTIGWLIPKGSSSVPVGVHIVGRRVSFVVDGSVSYVAHVPCIESTPLSVTVLFQPVEDFIPSNDSVVLTSNSQGLELATTDFSITFEMAYSVVDYTDLIEATKWREFENVESAIYGLRTLVSSGLAAFYKKDRPIQIYGDVSCLSYMNVVVQTRTIGLPFAASMSMEMCKLFIKFKPDSYNLADGWLKLRAGSSALALPCKSNTGKNDVPSYIAAMSGPVTLDAGKYYDKICAIAKMKYQRLSISLYTDGMVTRADGKNATLRVPLGNPSGTPVVSFIVPTDLWSICTKLLKSKRFQMLYDKEGLICLRTAEEIILLRALR